MSQQTRSWSRLAIVTLVVMGLGAFVRGGEPVDNDALKIGLASAKITPTEPIRMAGYASRDKPSEGVLAELFAKAMAIEDAEGERVVILTVDVIGFAKPVAEYVCDRIHEKTQLERRQIMLCPSHTHTGPVIGIPGATGYELEGEEEKVVHRFCDQLATKLSEISAAALEDLQPAKLSRGVGVAEFAMNRREFTDRGVRLGFNPAGYVDRSVPVLRVDAPDGSPRALLFGCACHCTTLTGKHFQLSGDYAGFAQQYIEEQHPEVQAMFVAGCGGSANPYPRGTVEAVQVHGKSLGQEVCRVISEKLAPVRGPLKVEYSMAKLPLKVIRRKATLEEMADGPSYLAYNARKLLKLLEEGGPIRHDYSTPFAVWQFGEDLTLVALPGEVVNGYVPLLRKALGPRKLWIAAYTNDCFGYLPTEQVLVEGGYETRCLYSEPGFFPSEVEAVVIKKVREMATDAGREIPGPAYGSKYPSW